MTDKMSKMMNKIIIADDEIRMRKLVRDFLKKSGYEVLEASDGAEAIKVFFDNPDTSLVILDVMMPNKNGYEALSAIREVSKVPVMMLTAKSAEEDELLGFSKGVDEYITKPFSPKILVARVDALLRRTASEDSRTAASEHVISACGITIDSDAHEAYADNEQLTLSGKEYDLLKYFIENKGMALSREQILTAVWDYDYYGDARTIDTHVKMLRSKLGDKGKCIKTVWGMGYKLEENK